MAQFDKVNIKIGSTHILAESISINQSSPNTPLYALNYSRNIDTAPNPVKNTINIDYYPEIHNEPNIAIISGWKNATTGNLSTNITLGGVTFVGYLNSYSFDVIPNQIITAKANYDVFTEVSSNFSNQSGTYNTTNNTGLLHYWNTKFLQGQSLINNTDILQLSYSFNSEIKPSYQLGSSSVSQVSAISAVENINVISESQNNIVFGGEDFNSDVFSVDGIRLSGFANNNRIDISLSGFSSQTNSTSISNGELVLFNSEFNKYY